MRRIGCSLLLIVLVAFLEGCEALVATPTFRTCRRCRLCPTLATANENETPSENNNNNGGLIFQGGNMRDKLASAFSRLDESDQYDAVLTGLCAKVLDDPNNSSPDKDATTITSLLEDPIKLVEEMNARNVRASGRSLMALVDATVKTESAGVMARIMSLCRKNGAVARFGSLQNGLVSMPTSEQQKVRCPDGTKKTRRERLDGLANVPTDEREKEIASALALSALVGLCFVYLNDYTGLFLTGLFAVGVLDNFYSVLKLAGVKLPDRMPLGLGTGKVTGTVVRGLTRLSSSDTERECRCEAAAFFCAYTLGLPCFAFRPNALEAAVLVTESMNNNNNDIDPLLSDAGILKMLVWLMAPVAMESAKHPQLIVSDPRESDGLLTRLQDRQEEESSSSVTSLWTNEQERKDVLKWAYTEADLLLRDHKKVVQDLSERLASGSATIGDCVAVVEGW